MYRWIQYNIANVELSTVSQIQENILWQWYRSSRPMVLCKRVFLEISQSLFFNKVAGLLENILWHRCFPVNFVKFLRTTFLTEYLWWLLLAIMIFTRAIPLYCKTLLKTFSEKFYRWLLCFFLNMNLSPKRHKLK